MKTLLSIVTSFAVLASISAAGINPASVIQDEQVAARSVPARECSSCCNQAARAVRTSPVKQQRGCSEAQPVSRRPQAAQAVKPRAGCGQKARAGRGCGSGAADMKPRRQGRRGRCGEGRRARNIEAPAATIEAPATYLERLQSVLGDELYARDFYQSAAGAHSARRYQNLARAEQRHADAIASAIRSLGGEPVLEHKQEFDAPISQPAADQNCREIELHVIEIYAGLIKDCPDPGLLPMLKNIQAANWRHLNAVSR